MFPNLHFIVTQAKLALQVLHVMHVTVVRLSACRFLEVVHPFLICKHPFSVCYYKNIIKLLIHSPLKTEHLVLAFSFPCL